VYSLLRNLLNSLFVKFVSLPLSKLNSARRVVQLLGLREGLAALRNHYFGSGGSRYRVNVFFGPTTKTFSLRAGTSDLSILSNVILGELDVLKEPEAIGLAAASPSGLIIDGGAHIGITATALSRMFPRSKVIAIEADPENFSLLVENTRDESKIMPVWGALVGSNRANRQKTITLNSRGNGYQGFTVLERPLDRPVAEVRSDSVPTLSLANVVANSGVEPWLVKLDIEGGEKELMEEDFDTLVQIPAILIELHERIAGPEVGASFVSLCDAKGFVQKDQYDKYLIISVTTT